MRRLITAAVGLTVVLASSIVQAGSVPNPKQMIARSAGPIAGSGGQVDIFTPSETFIMTGFCTTSGSKDSTYIVGTSYDSQSLKIFASTVGGTGNPNGGGGEACTNLTPGIAFVRNQPVSFHNDETGSINNVTVYGWTTPK